MLLLVIGIAYLFKRPALFDAPRHCAAAYSDLVSAFLLNLTNPTAVLSFLGLLAALGLGHPRRWWSTLSLVGGIFCGSTAWWIVLSAVVDRFRGRFDPRIVMCMNRVAGLAIGGFGVALMVLGLGQNSGHNFFHFLSL